MLAIAEQLVHLREEGHQVVLVTSGAQAAGRERLGYATSPKEMPQRQMLAAVGQTHLMLAWEQVFGMFDTQVAQVLLTRADLGDRRRYLNARDALQAILQNHIVPVINENDAVATEEIRVGDNDNLSALVANVLYADLLIILTDQPGLFTSDPRKDPAAKLISHVSQINDEVKALAGGTKTGLGTGGMATKLQAAELATQSGTEVVIAQGTQPNVILDAAHGQPVGTRFAARVIEIESRRRWILSEQALGAVVVDEGAARAVCESRSLLPVGVREVLAEFDRGEVIAVRNVQGRVIARGISRYNSGDAKRIAGKRSDEIVQILGFDYAPMLIHADDMVVLPS
jgi:glutamate 5-kinase